MHAFEYFGGVPTRGATIPVHDESGGQFLISCGIGVGVRARSKQGRMQQDLLCLDLRRGVVLGIRQFGRF
jgi:hypothetical protein